VGSDLPTQPSTCTDIIALQLQQELNVHIPRSSGRAGQMFGGTTHHGWCYVFSHVLWRNPSRRAAVSRGVELLVVGMVVSWWR
jgi:hypothetical protein